MNRKSFPQFISLLFFSVLVAGVVTFFHFTKTRVVYVTSTKLVEGYKGMIEARLIFERKKNSMTANIDSLNIEFERARLEYMQSAQTLTAKQRTTLEQKLVQQQAQLIKYSEVIEQKIQEEDEEMTQAVLNQINSFVEKYALSEGYDIILGTTASGSLLYGNKSMDVTDPLLEALNKNYSGK